MQYIISLQINIIGEILLHYLNVEQIYILQDLCVHMSLVLGHTEAVQMLFNPAVVSYKELLTVLFDRMDPTTLNR